MNNASSVRNARGRSDFASLADFFQTDCPLREREALSGCQLEAALVRLGVFGASAVDPDARWPPRASSLHLIRLALSRQRCAFVSPARPRRRSRARPVARDSSVRASPPTHDYRIVLGRTVSVPESASSDVVSSEGPRRARSSPPRFPALTSPVSHPRPPIRRSVALSPLPSEPLRPAALSDYPRRPLVRCRRRRCACRRPAPALASRPRSPGVAASRARRSPRALASRFAAPLAPPSSSPLTISARRWPRSNPRSGTPPSAPRAARSWPGTGR